MNPARPALRVDRARLANARAGDRARLASALAMASPAATGVGERALLIVRRLRVDRPLGAGVEGFGGELIDRIRAAKTNARRGAIGSGESLYFEDDTALECAIVAASLGGAPLPEMMRRAVPDSETPLLRWRRRILVDGRTLPRLLAALTEAGIAGAWLARFDEAELRAAGDLLLRTYGSAARLPEPIRGDRGDVEPRAAAPRSRTVPAPAAVEEVLMRARAATPERGARMLIAVALLAARRPELMATHMLADALTAAFDAPARRPPSEHAHPAIPADAVSPADEETASTRVRPAARRRAIEEHPPISPQPLSPPKRATSGAPIPAAARRDPPEAALLALFAAPQRPVVPMAVTSDHAGLFFLLNVFLALGLYGDFTDQTRRVRGLSPFELLLLLGRRWIGAEFARDPLAPALRGLAGLGARERPGDNFEAPAWQAPPDWLAPWPNTPSRLVRGGFGASHWHAAGFPIADQWLVARSAAWMRRRWVACLARYIEARLARALGCDDRAEAVATLLRRPGSVHIDDGSVEIAFALDTHPLSIRLAGLDRDPGWIPAAGHAIGFRFA